nr:MAG: hypothetical protein DIU78_16610 [Pseudomonadota bacterium]
MGCGDLPVEERGGFRAPLDVLGESVWMTPTLLRAPCSLCVALESARCSRFSSSGVRRDARCATARRACDASRLDAGVGSSSVRA